MKLISKLILICILLFPLMAMAQDPNGECQFSRDKFIHLFNFDLWDGYYAENETVDSLLALDGSSFFNGYSAPVIWNIPADAHTHIQLIWENWEVVTVEYSPQTPDVYYVRAYDFNISEVDDDHPCLALIMDVESVDAILTHP